MPIKTKPDHELNRDAALFVARQSIINRHGVTVGFELLFRGEDTKVAVIHDDFLCTVAVVERALNSIGLERLIGSQDGYLNCSDDFIMSPLVDVLPPKRFVLELLETSRLSSVVAKRCKSLRRLGFRIALDDVDVYTAEIEGFLPNVDIVKIDWSLIPANARGKVVSRFKEAGKQVLAEKVEHREDFDEALRTGCDLIQGFYFSKPEVLAGREILPSVGFVLRIIQQLLDDAPLNDIVQSLNQAPIVATQLLRLANSGAMPNARGLQFSSLHQALAMVGSAKLLQWCSLVLYANPNGLPSFDDPLLHLAEQRARFMEQTAKRLYLNDAWLNQAAYLTGMLSLLHVPHGVDVLTFLKDLPLDDAIKSAISYRVGYLGELISLAEHWERAGQGARPR